MQRYKNSYSKPSYKAYTPRSLRKKEQKTKKKLIWNTILGLVLIYILFAWGLPNLIGSLSFLNRFKSSGNPVPSASSSITLAPPVLDIPFDATNSASIQISGYSVPNSKVEIFLDDNLTNTASTNSDGSFQTDPISLNLGNNNIYGKTLDDTNHQESLASKTIQVVYNNDKPPLQINSPDENSQIKGGDKKVTVSGTTDPNDNISINGQNVIVSSDGSFSSSISINDGDNIITITATDSIGNTTTLQRHVNYSAS